MSLPILDLSAFTSPSSTTDSKRAAASALSAACRDHGFFYLRHTLGPLEQRALALAREFFLTSSPSTKSRISRLNPGDGGDGARGYQKLNENITQGKTDFHEGIDYYSPVVEPKLLDPAHPEKGYELLMGVNLFPQEVEGFQETFEAFWDELRKLGDRVMVAMAWALGYEEDEEVLLRQTRNGFWSARVIGYPELKKEDGGEGGISCGEHSDYGCTTFLLADPTPGALQVLAKTGEWIDADPIEGCYVVNIGDMMELWTNGLWASTRHRVIHTKSGFRVSIPFFYEPNFDAVVEPLDKCVAVAGGEKKYQPKKYGDHLIEKVSGNFYKAPEADQGK
ncbi:Clavaminate synthase-like protein [Ascodesmis nigricans]|uniref:Clavaminate synthase-like protein n=1 Tax=Ascodesmis nigricans TaxID=341454 RepID=A0A4S2MQP1_9PEZI|nr:Clavaminate synthase-like protein [Ascodesmis nigricans]